MESKKSSEAETVETKKGNNRFTTLQAECPRCGHEVVVEKFIVNAGRTVVATFACPDCTDIVQVFVEGESVVNAAPRKPQVPLN